MHHPSAFWSSVICATLLLLLSFPFSQQQSDVPTHSAVRVGRDWIDVHEESLVSATVKSALKPPMSVSQEDASIFVSIVTYRDSRCAATLRNLFTKAKNANRVFVGIVQQRHTEEDHFDCVADYCGANAKSCPHRDQIRFIEHTHQDSRGPHYARYFVQSQLLRDEDFCMQIDAHSDFATHWDSELLAQWAQTQNEFAVLSMQPPDVSALNQPSQSVPFLCQATINAQGLIVNLPPTEAVRLTQPLMSTLLSNGFSFSKCHAEKKTINDPAVQFLFDGDEFLRFARLWTRGYDIYTPPKALVFHDYSQSTPRSTKSDLSSVHGDSMEWERNGMSPVYRRFLYERSMDRIATVLGQPIADREDAAEPLSMAERLEAVTKYGLGTARSLGSLDLFSGIAVREKRVVQDRCDPQSIVNHFVPAVYTAADGSRLPWSSIDPNVDSGSAWGLDIERLSVGSELIPLLSSGSQPVFSIDSFTRLDYQSVETVSEDLESEFVDAEKSDAAEERLSEANAVQRTTEHIHRGGELWWMFQLIDSAVERAINGIDRELGDGHGTRAVKMFLILFPVALLVLYLAILTATNSLSSVFGFLSAKKKTSFVSMLSSSADLKKI